MGRDEDLLCPIINNTKNNRKQLSYYSGYVNFVRVVLK